MKTKLIIILTLIFISGCGKGAHHYLRGHNFQSGHELASYQGKLIQTYRDSGNISSTDLQVLEKNMWVDAAKIVCPSNLVIRQLVLIDLAKGEPSHEPELLSMVRTLSYEGQIWSEGYSYWRYTLEALVIWTEKFSNSEMEGLIQKIDEGFVSTAYLRDSVCYPVPIGDLRNEPLNEKMQGCLFEKDTIKVAIVERFITGDSVSYRISGIPIGVNTHVTIDTLLYKIHEGVPQGFKWYEGYDKKYESEEKAWEDLANPARMSSIKKLLK